MSRLYRTVLDLLHHSGLARAGRNACRGAGVVFMLHRVRPICEAQDGAARFRPNGGLSVTPDFLDAAIGLVKQQGYDLVPLQEVPRRLQAAREGRAERPFAAFTLDDGYRDNREHAWPVFRKHDCPFTIFVCPSFADGEGELWWEVLERAIAINDEVHPLLPDLPTRLPTNTLLRKKTAWQRLYPLVRYMDEHEQRTWVMRFGERHRVDVHGLCRELVMNWNELREMASDPLCGFGAHTEHHHALARLDEEEAHYEMAASRAHVEDGLGVKVGTLAYPYGDPDSAGPREFALARKLGFSVAVTTRKGHLYPEHLDHLTALPRLSLNGFYQSLKHLDVLLSGLPFMLYNRFQRVNVSA